MRVENILQALTTQLLNKKGAKVKSNAVNSNEDKVEISPEARGLQKGNAVNGANNDLSIREEKIKEVITKMNKGFYSNPQMVSKLVDNLFKMFGI